MSIRQVADEVGKSYTSVRYWMNRYGLSSSHVIRRRWTDAMLCGAVRECDSYASVLRRLGLDPRGSNYKTVKRHIERLELDTSHFLGRSVCRNKPSGRGNPIGHFLKLNGPAITTSRLRKRLLREGMIEDVCSICGRLPTWEGKPLVLRLDHINGNNKDNRKENLRLVCPNCDSQLPTYCGRNTKRPIGRAD